MATRHVRLRHLAERDSPFLYELMTSPLSGGRVRFGGATPSPDKVRASLWESVLAQFVIEGAASGEPLGLVAITSPNFRDGFAYVSALGQPEARGRGLVMEGVFLGVHYAFLTWPFRKLYMEASEESHQAFGSGLGMFFAEEGRLRGHTFWNGPCTATGGRATPSGCSTGSSGRRWRSTAATVRDSGWTRSLASPLWRRQSSRWTTGPSTPRRRWPRSASIRWR
jgi:RimJ/RimL family protein N-acetyltransferase